MESIYQTKKLHADYTKTFVNDFFLFVPEMLHKALCKNCVFLYIKTQMTKQICTPNGETLGH